MAKAIIRKPGVYLIANTVDGKAYVGSTNNLNDRWRSHCWSLRHNTHNNPYLQRAWNDCGAEAFVFIVLCQCSREMLRTREQQYMDSLNLTSRDSGYNVGDSMGYGIPQSVETRERRAVKLRGKKIVMTPEWKANIAASRTGTHHTEEQKRKISKSLAWKMKLSEEQIAEIREQLAAGVSQYRLRKIYKCGGSIIGKIIAGTGNYARK